MFLLNWIQYQNGSLSVLRLEIARDLWKMDDDLVTSSSQALKCLMIHLVLLWGNNLSIPQHRYLEFISYSSCRVLQPALSLVVPAVPAITNFQVPTLEMHILHFCFDLLPTCALWVLQHMSRNCV